MNLLVVVVPFTLCCIMSGKCLLIGGDTDKDRVPVVAACCLLWASPWNFLFISLAIIGEFCLNNDFLRDCWLLMLVSIRWLLNWPGYLGNLSTLMQIRDIKELIEESKDWLCFSRHCRYFLALQQLTVCSEQSFMNVNLWVSGYFDQVLFNSSNLCLCANSVVHTTWVAVQPLN